MSRDGWHVWKWRPKALMIRCRTLFTYDWEVGHLGCGHIWEVQSPRCKDICELRTWLPACTMLVHIGEGGGARGGNMRDCGRKGTAASPRAGNGSQPCFCK
jgi:hypothetical protein